MPLFCLIFAILPMVKFNRQLCLSSYKKKATSPKKFFRRDFGNVLLAFVRGSY